MKQKSESKNNFEVYLSNSGRYDDIGRFTYKGLIEDHFVFEARKTFRRSPVGDIEFWLVCDERKYNNHSGLDMMVARAPKELAYFPADMFEPSRDILMQIKPMDICLGLLRHNPVALILRDMGLITEEA